MTYTSDKPRVSCLSVTSMIIVLSSSSAESSLSHACLAGSTVEQLVLGGQLGEPRIALFLIQLRNMVCQVVAWAESVTMADALGNPSKSL